MSEPREKAFARANKKRQKVADIKLRSGCVDCGYNKSAEALEFDHKDNNGVPYTGKQRTVASLMYSSWGVIQAEIDKCEVVCCNCHAIRTAKRRSYS